MNSNDDNGEVGGLFRVSRRKKINVNDQEDYTLNSQNEKRNWDLDEVRSMKEGKRVMEKFLFVGL